jgi:hypothetical protein
MPRQTDNPKLPLKYFISEMNFMNLNELKFSEKDNRISWVGGIKSAMPFSITTLTLKALRIINLSSQMQCIMTPGPNVIKTLPVIYEFL